MSEQRDGDGAKCLRCGERLTPPNVPDWEQPVCPRCWRDGHKCSFCKGPLPLYWDKPRCPGCMVQGFGKSNDPMHGGPSPDDPATSMLGCATQEDKDRLLDELSAAAMQGMPLPFRGRAQERSTRKPTKRTHLPPGAKP